MAATILSDKNVSPMAGPFPFPPDPPPSPSFDLDRRWPDPVQTMAKVKADASFSSSCPFAKLALTISSPQLHLAMPSPGTESTPSSSYGPSPVLTPSFEVNTPEEVAPVPELISLIQRIDTSDPKKSLQALDVPDLDFSRNVSALLKDGTARAHVQAENSLGAAALVKGELGRQEYVRWLAVLWRLYE